MLEYIKVDLDGKQVYLNDLMVDLDYYKKDFVVSVDGVLFELSPSSAKEYQLDYGRDNYGQNAVRAARSLRNMRDCEYSCGFVREVPTNV